MVEFKICENFTEGMSGPDITDALYRGRLGLCPYHKLGIAVTDGILDDFLKIGALGRMHRTMSVTKIGTSRSGVPCARVEIIQESGSVACFTPSICEFCPMLGGCSPGDRHAIANDFWGSPDDDDGD